MVTSVCRECGAQLPPETTGGTCPRCGACVEEPSGEETRTVVLVEEEVSPWREGQPLPGGRPLVETRLGPYELREELGRGGMGVVYRAVHATLGRQVAIKMIHAGATADERQREMLLAEARVAAQVRHPNIVGVYGFGEIHGWQYMAMELVEGPSLGDLIRRSPLEPDRAVRIVRQVALAMQHLHQRGIVHRDIKPSNILVDEHDTPYVTDFGLAKVREIASALSMAGLVAGTPSYMSPEQASGVSRAIGPRTDVYSLGAVLYALLTARPPFAGKTVPETMLNVTRHEAIPIRRLRPGVPEALELICRRCLEKDPARRYPTMAALANDLERYLAGDPVEAARLPIPRRLTLWWRRSPALASRYLCLWTFWGIEQAWYYGLHVTSSSFYLTTTLLVPLWALVTAGLAYNLRRTGHAEPVRVLWLCLDVIFLTGILLASDGLHGSPLVMLYPVVIASSALWHRVRLVWLATVLCLLSDFVLWMAAPYIRPEEAASLDVHLVFCAALLVVGLLTAHQVGQFGILRRYLHSQRIVD